MKRSDKTLGRRKFLETGIFSGVIVAISSRGELLDSPLLHSRPHVKPKNLLCKKSSARLLQIACTYGSEFGEIKEIKNGCL